MLQEKLTLANSMISKYEIDNSRNANSSWRMVCLIIQTKQPKLI